MEPTSRTVDLGGPVHYLDHPAAAAPDRTLVLVHGLGASHISWRAVGHSLTEHGRVIAVDLAGFGRTPLAGRRAGIEANRALLDRFLDAVVGAPAVLVGNSMGGMIAILQASRRPESVARLVLVDPALPPPSWTRPDPRVLVSFALYTAPLLGGAFLRYRGRMGAEKLVAETLRLVCVDPTRVPEDVREALVAFAHERARMPWATTAFLQAERSLMVLLSRGRRGYLRAVRELAVPTLLVHGSRDGLVPVAAARRAAASNPRIELAVIDGVGHAPQMEAPEEFLAAVIPWLRTPTAVRL